MTTNDQLDEKRTGEFIRKNRDIASYYLNHQKQSKDPKFFTLGDVDRILRTIEKSKSYRADSWGAFQRARDYMLVKLMWSLSLRPSEARQLKIEDFQRIEKGIELTIRPETNKERKSRSLPVPEKLWLNILEFLAFPREVFWRGSPYLFPSFHGSPMCSATWGRKFRSILQEAGLYSFGLKSYSLRHGRATYLIDQGASIFDVQRLLGHSTTECTMIYTHMTSRSKERIRDILELGL